nr:immunoglobulin heavy chain junction region [Macaca mulatta]MOW33170.1 immunoglobulin heavy chain junction region [Macaca mulatta]MOW33281.1 immunoglobulin heavy chain junction region [Macaca mulatta]MOW33372.1 immunoglobulin heavy chain junction region [Macaca mulatta]MOW33532.1 immunoglobulin heavy chain junction region [Macaca mulatta]
CARFYGSSAYGNTRFDVW